MASLSAGTLDVDDDGVVTGSGWARNRYDAEVGTDEMVATLAMLVPPTPGDTTPPYSDARPATTDDRDAVLAAKVTLLKGIANRILAVTQADVAHLNANL
jgi:hypothetical protein